MSRGVQALPQVQMRVAQAGAGEPNFVAPEKLVSGNPKQTAWVQHASADGRFVGFIHFANYAAGIVKIAISCIGHAHISGCPVKQLYA